MRALPQLASLIGGSLLALLSFSACNLAEPWQPIASKRETLPTPYAPLTTASAPDTRLKAQLDQLPSNQRAFLAWLDQRLVMSSASVVPRLIDEKGSGLRQLSIESLSQDQVLEIARKALQDLAVGELTILRSGRFTPASWDLRLSFSSLNEESLSDEIRGRLERTLTALGRSKIQGLVYLDDLTIAEETVTFSLRDRRARIPNADVEEARRSVRSLLNGESVTLSFEPVFDGETLKQRIFRISVQTPHRAEAPTSLIGQLRWSPEGGPNARPTEGHADIYERGDIR